MQQTFPSSSSGTIPGFPLQHDFSTSRQFPNQQGFLPETSLHQGTDPNSPELFKQNIQIAQQQVIQLQNLARNALTGIQNAYHPGNSPAQTQADITSIKQALQNIIGFMSQTGVGALPLLPLAGHNSSITVPTESELMADMNSSIQVLYQKLRRNQESAAVVANLLGAPDSSARGGK